MRTRDVPRHGPVSPEGCTTPLRSSVLKKKRKGGCLGGCWKAWWLSTGKRPLGHKEGELQGPKPLTAAAAVSFSANQTSGEWSPPPREKASGHMDTCL